MDSITDCGYRGSTPATRASRATSDGPFSPQDGRPITTTETAQEVCGEYGPTGHDPLHVDTSLEGPHPPALAYVPTNLFTLSDADVTNLPLRFRVTDLHHDVDINSVTVTNESMEPPSTGLRLLRR